MLAALILQTKENKERDARAIGLASDEDEEKADFSTFPEEAGWKTCDT